MKRVMITAVLPLLLLLPSCAGTEKTYDVEVPHPDAPRTERALTFTGEGGVLKPIEVETGRLVTLMINNLNGNCTFTIHRFHVRERLKPGEASPVSFYASEPGIFRYRFSCGEDGFHEGTLSVRD